MAFRKLTQTNGEGNAALPPPQPAAAGAYPNMLQVSGAAFNGAMLLTSAGATITIFLFYALRQTWSIEDADVQALTSLGGGLSGLMIAIPLFLKDLHRGSSFWKQFFVIALVFILATVAGVFAFLNINGQTIDVRVQLWFFIALGASFCVNVIAFVFGSARRRPGSLSISIDPEFTMLLSLLALVAGTWLAPAHRLLYAFLFLSIYGLYLTVLLMVAVVCQLMRNALHPEQPLAGQNLRIGQGIQRVVSEHEDTALTEPELISYLRHDVFAGEQEIINSTVVNLLVTQMDAEVQPGRPMLSITDNGRVVPRWSAKYSQVLAAAQPAYMALSYNSDYFPSRNQMGEINNWAKLRNYDSLLKVIYQQLATTTGLSAELLAENDSLRQKYPSLCIIYSTDGRYKTYEGLLLAPAHYLPAPDYVRGDEGPLATVREVRQQQLRVAPGAFYADDPLLTWLSRIEIKT